MPLLKICGLARLEDAELADKYADYAGMIVSTVKTHRRILDPLKAKELAETLSRAKPVLVVKGLSIDAVLDLASKLEVFKVIQYHDPLTPENAQQLSLELRSIGVRLAVVVEAYSWGWIPSHPVDYRLVDYEYLLIDGPKTKPPIHDYGLSTPFHRLLEAIRTSKRIGLAGKITPFNAVFIAELNPYLIDVSSGVEVEPGVKDYTLVEMLARVVKSWRH